MNPKKMAVLIVGAVLFFIVALMSGSMFETNNAGYYQVKQAAVTGTMSVRNDPGIYAQMFGNIYTYHVSDIYFFSKHDAESGNTMEGAPIKVRFQDGGTAEVTGSIKFRLPGNPDQQLTLHKDFKNYENVKDDMIRQTVTEALMQTATLLKAEESYSTRRSDFTALAEDQIKEGIYETESEEVKHKDVEGNEFVERNVKIKLDKAGHPVIRKTSPLAMYHIEILQFVIKDIDFDKTIDELIQKKKEAEQLKVVARANAEKAKQDAITAEEQGKANVAKAKAAKEVEKIEAVTAAQKEFEVAEFNKKRDAENAAAVLIKKKADAEANRLLVNAGLTPQEKAQFAKDTAIGVAQALAEVKFPGMMIIGGEGKTGQLDPFTAVGLESLINISNKLATGK